MVPIPPIRHLEFTRATIEVRCSSFRPKWFLHDGGLLNPLKAPKHLPVLNPSNFVPENGFPVVKALSPKSSEIIGYFSFDAIFVVYLALGPGIFHPVYTAVAVSFSFSMT